MESFKLKPIIGSIQSTYYSNPLCFSTQTSSFLRLNTSNHNCKPNSISSSYNPNNRIPKKPYNYNFNPLCAVATLLQSVKRFASVQTQKLFSRFKSYTIESELAFSQCNVNGYSQNGAFGVAILSMTSSAKCRLSPIVATLAANPTFISGMLAWFVAQSMKIFLNFWVERKWDFRIVFASGGMPSSHSALCTALTTSVALCHGVADSLFPVCLGFTLIVMYDAIGVRRHAGMQAEVLNMIVADLFQGHPISQRKLKELLGHTPLQVVAGAMLGILVACFCCRGCLVAT